MKIDKEEEALQKRVKERLHDIADARIELREQRMQPSEPVPVAPRFSYGVLVAAMVATLGIGLLLGAAAMQYLLTSPWYRPPYYRQGWAL